MIKLSVRAVPQRKSASVVSYYTEDAPKDTVTKRRKTTSLRHSLSNLEEINLIQYVVNGVVMCEESECYIIYCTSR